LDQQFYLLTLTDKASKFQLVRKLPNKEAAIPAFTLLPLKTITSDNGAGLAAHE
jgi:IS30 family transposase